MLEERDVVAREYDLRVSENPDRKAYDAMIKALLGDNPVGRSTIGTPKSIHALTLEHALAFHSKFYVPANMVVIVSGNLTAEQVKLKTEAVFGESPAGKANPQRWFHTPVRADTTALIRSVDANAVFDSYKLSALSDWSGSGDAVADWYTIRFVEQLLGSALPGGLGKPLRTDQFVVSGFDVYLREVIDGQILFGFQANPDEGIGFSAVGAALGEAVNASAELGVSEKTIERLRNRWLQVAERRKDEADYLRGRSLALLTAGLEPNSSRDHRRRIEQITKSQIDSLLDALATPHRRIEYHLTKQEQ